MDDLKESIISIIPGLHIKNAKRLLSTINNKNNTKFYLRIIEEDGDRIMLLNNYDPDRINVCINRKQIILFGNNKKPYFDKKHPTYLQKIIKENEGINNEIDTETIDFIKKLRITFLKKKKSKNYKQNNNKLFLKFNKEPYLSETEYSDDISKDIKLF